MQDEHPPSFAELRRRFQVLPAEADTISLEVALRAGDDPWHIVRYLSGLGVQVDTLQRLYTGITGLDDEEELTAFLCCEGVAVSLATDDHWILFTE